MATTGVGDLVHVYDTGDRRIAVAEEESDLIDALAGQQGAGSDCVTERVHRRHGSGGYGCQLAVASHVMEHRERGAAMFVRRAPLRLSKCARDVPLGQRSRGARGEDERLGRRLARGELVPHEDQRQLSWDRHGPGGAVSLVGRRLPLRSTCHANVISASLRTSAHVSPQISETRAPVRTATVNSVRHGSEAAASVCSICSGVKTGERLAQRDLRPLGGQHQRDRIYACEREPPGRELVYAADRSEDSGDRRLALASLSQLSDQGREVIGGDGVETAVPVMGVKMLLDGAAVAGPCGRSQVENRASKPPFGCFAKPHP